MSTLKKAAKPKKEKFHRFIGISFAGGKSDKTCLAVLEYHPLHHKIFLTKLIEKIKSESEFSADLKVYQFIQQYHGEVDLLAFDVPISLPPCIECKLICPGYESCEVAEVEWMRMSNDRQMKDKKPKKPFTPYTQRAVELYLAEVLEEKMQVHHALGANLAPHTARAHFLKRRLKDYSLIEVFPRLSLWRIGKALKINSSHLKFHKHAVSGAESRLHLLKAIAEYYHIFIYDQDLRAMAENNHAFEALLSALTALLRHVGQTEAKPRNFPKKSSWIEFPVKDLKWKV